MDELQLSEGVAVVLHRHLRLSLLFSLQTHKRLIGGDPHDMPEAESGASAKARR